MKPKKNIEHIHYVLSINFDSSKTEFFLDYEKWFFLKLLIIKNVISNIYFFIKKIKNRAFKIYPSKSFK